VALTLHLHLPVLVCVPLRSSLCSSFGCVLFEILTGSIPFGGGSISKAELAERVGARGERPVLPHGLLKPFRDILVSCWQQHPRARMSMKQVVAALSAIKLE